MDAPSNGRHFGGWQWGSRSLAWPDSSSNSHWDASGTLHARNFIACLHHNGWRGELGKIHQVYDLSTWCGPKMWKWTIGQYDEQDNDTGINGGKIKQVCRDWKRWLYPFEVRMAWDKRQRRRANLLGKTVANGFWGSDSTRARAARMAQSWGWWGWWWQQWWHEGEDGEDGEDDMKVRTARMPQRQGQWEYHEGRDSKDGNDGNDSMKVMTGKTAKTTWRWGWQGHHEGKHCKVQSVGISVGKMCEKMMNK